MPTHATGQSSSPRRLPNTDRGLAMPIEEREQRRLSGLLPPVLRSPRLQVALVLERVRACDSDLAKYVYLNGLRERDRELFYDALVQHIDELLPVVYTPVVGQACQRYGRIWQQPQGLFITAEDKDRIPELLAHWPEDEVRAIVVTDGERILGLGDLGAHGMGIPVGKLSLYAACAGVHPDHCLPITLDVGCNNDQVRDDHFYLGIQSTRLDGDEYRAFLDAFMAAVADRFPDCLVQFEDFATENARALLERYRDQACVFNDDIQGTAAVTLAGLLSALRVTGKPLTEQRLLMLGAGEAGVGIADLMVEALKAEGLDQAQAMQHCWLSDSSGLVVASRDDLDEHKQRYAHEAEAIEDFGEAVNALEPTAIIGVAGQPGLFDQAVIEAMAQLNERPIIFALSNPTSKAECTAEQAYQWTDGRALFASGSPFDPVELNGNRFDPGQANNAYVFPGIALGLTASHAQRVPEDVFLAAARALADQVTDQDLEAGRLYPPLEDIRLVSKAIAIAVAQVIFDHDLANIDRPADVRQLVSDAIYEPFGDLT